MAIGWNLLLDLYQCEEIDKLDDAKFIEETMIELVNVLKCRLISSFFYEFSPYSVSGCCILAESHCSIHTWREKEMACIDVFSCKEIGDKNIQEAIKYLIDKFKPYFYSFDKIIRGKRVEPADNTICQIKVGRHKIFREIVSDNQI